MKDYKNVVTTIQGTYGVISHHLRKRSSKKLHMNFNKVPPFKDPELRNIQQICNKKFRDRKFQEQADLNNFLKSTKIEAQFRIDLLSSASPTETVLYYATQFIEIKTYNKDDFIYLSGDKSYNLYLVLKGEVNLNKIDTEKVNMTMEEYYKYIKEEMLHQSDPMLIMNIIDTNSHIFPVRKQNDLNEMDSIVFLIKLTLATNELSLPTIDKIKEIYQEYKQDHRIYHFDQVIKGDKDFHKYHFELTDSITEKERFYSQLLQRTNFNSVPVIKMSYLCIRAVNPFGYFGNFKIWNMEMSIRSECSKCASDVIVMCINKSLYGTCLLNEQRQMKEKEMEKVHQSYFFKDLTRVHFNKDIYHSFDLKEYFRGQVLFNSDEALKCFYIVKEGLIDLSLNSTSLIELDILLEGLIKCDKRLCSIDEEYSINHPYSLVQAHLNKKRTYKLFGSSKKQMFGDWELYYLKKKTPFTATITSEKAIIYRYKYIDYENTKEDKIILRTSLKEQAYNKLSLIIERLKTIRYSYYSKIDTEIQIKLKEEELIPRQNPSQAISFKSSTIKLDPSKMSKSVKIIPEREIDVYTLDYPKRERNEWSLNKTKDTKENQYETFNEKDLQELTCFQRNKKKNRKTLRYYLPPIQLNLSKENKYNLQCQHPITTEGRNNSFRKQMKVMMPLSTVHNVPLINKLKYNYLDKDSKNNFDDDIDDLSKSITKKHWPIFRKGVTSYKVTSDAYNISVQTITTK